MPLMMPLCVVCANMPPPESESSVFLELDCVVSAVSGSDGSAASRYPLVEAIRVRTQVTSNVNAVRDIFFLHVVRVVHWFNPNIADDAASVQVHGCACFFTGFCPHPSRERCERSRCPNLKQSPEFQF